MPSTLLLTALFVTAARGAPPADAPPPEEARVVVVSGAGRSCPRPLDRLVGPFLYL